MLFPRRQFLGSLVGLMLVPFTRRSRAKARPLISKVEAKAPSVILVESRDRRFEARVSWPVDYDFLMGVLGCLNADEFMGEARGTVRVSCWDSDRHLDDCKLTLNIEVCSHDWNLIRYPETGGLAYVVDSVGKPLYPYVAMEPLMAIEWKEVQIPQPPWRSPMYGIGWPEEVLRR